MSDSLNLVLKVLEVLTSDKKPHVGKVPDKGNTEEDGFDLLLKTKISSYHDLLTTERYNNLNILLDEEAALNVKRDSTRWHFVCCCLETLTMLQKSITMAMKVKVETPSELKPSQAPPLPPDALSIAHQKMILTAIQFVVILGISPNLDDGVGIPIERRSEYAKVLLKSSPQENSTCVKKISCLFYCVKVFMSCLSIPSLGALILSRHLNDLLASLLTIIHGKDVQGLKKNITQEHSDEPGKGDTKPSNMLDPSFEKIPPSDWTPASVVDMVTKKQVTSLTQPNKIKIPSEIAISDKTHQTENISEVTEPGHFDPVGKTSHKKSAASETSVRDTPMAVIGDREVETCEEWLQQLLDKVHPPILVRELLLLQSGVPPVPQTGVSKKKMLGSPTWLRNVCGRLLTGILMKPKGVLHVIQGILDAPGDKSKSKSSDWRKCDSVAKVIASCPMLSTSVEEYYALISPQIIDLLQQTDRQGSKEYLRVACTTMARMRLQYPQLTQKYVLSPLMAPLEQCLETEDIELKEQQRTMIKEKDMSTCLENLHKVFVAGSEPCTGLMTALLPVSMVLFSLFCFTKKGVSHLRLCCQEILVSLLKRLDKKVAVSTLYQWVLQKGIPGNSAVTTSVVRMHQSVSFAPGPEGGVVVVIKGLDSDHGDEDDDISKESMIAATIDILKELQKDGLTGDFFLYLLMELTEIISQEVDDSPSDGVTVGQAGQELMEAELRERQAVQQFYHKVNVMGILAAICEEIGPSCLTNTHHTLKFVQVTLERGVQVCKNTQDDVLGVFESETLTMAMGMLTAVLTGTIKISDDDREHMKKLMPLLEDIKSNHPEHTIQEMASDLHVAIATHGVIWSELLKSAKVTKAQLPTEKVSQRQKERPVKQPMVEVISESENKPHPSKTKFTKPSDSTETILDYSESTDNQGYAEKEHLLISSDANKEQKAKKVSMLSQAFEELHDPLIPVRGHALIVMNKLIQNNNPEAIEKKEILLKIFKENLHHPDSYLYLTSVTGLVSLVDRFPDDVIPVLIKEFLSGACSSAVSERETTRKADDRIKVGECLVQTSRKLGDMAPKYRDYLLSAFLQGCKDRDPLVRASSLSNLGELCKVLRFSLGNFIHEIFTCGCTLLKSDTSVEVRQAAALMVNLQIQGLGTDTLKVLDSVVRDTYRTLRQCMLTEKEDSVKMQITLALNELDSITREFLFPKQKLEKKIRVLDPN